MASIRWVRPLLTTSANSSAFASSASLRCSSAGIRSLIRPCGRGDVDRAGEDVVAGLGGVDVVVRVHVSPERLRWRARRSPRWCSCWTRCPSRSGRRRSGTRRRARWPRRSRRPATIASARSRSSTPSSALACGRGALDQTEGRDQRRVDRDAGDREVLDRSLGLGLVEGGGRHPHLAHGVVLDAEVVVGGSGHGQVCRPATASQRPSPF